MQEYVVGFMFNEERTRVLLIEKQRPSWQKGKLNGVGGHIEDTDQCPKAAMIREFKEETGIETTWETWTHFATLGNESTFRVHFYHAVGPIRTAEMLTDEVPRDYPLKPRLPANCLPNLSWLIPMALSMDKDSAESFDITERYAAAA
jgi:8-oxo-dGTP diphosphatase